MFVRSCWPLFLALVSCYVFAKPATKPEVFRRADDASSNFVSQQGDTLMVNGSTFSYIGTTAYWLASLNTDEDIDTTLGNISKAGFNAVRTWAFNDVDTIPENGTWFQLIQNGTLTINQGPNGLQKLDKVMELAKNHGLYVLLSLTNNWNPRPLTDNIPVVDPLSALHLGARDVTPGTNNSHPRGFLSNDYGGMDAYVRNFGGPAEHDQFFTNETLINAFKNFTQQIVTRYANNTNVLAWELANDPQCSSSLNASATCVPQNVTQWHSTIAKHVKSLDPNHIVSTGNQGFFCTGCPKLFPRVTTPPPRPSPRAEARRNVLPWTRERILKERKEAFKKTRALAKKSGQTADGIRIRGRWVSTPTRRQDSSLGPAFDGSHGVDSEDILNIPEIGFGSFMLFPNQDQYGANDPNLPPFNNTVQQGLDWIRSHADSSRLFGKPVSMSGFGLVTQQNSQAFTPFNSSVAPFASDCPASGCISSRDLQPQIPFVTQEQQLDAYQQWIQAGVLGGIQGIIQYQWTQPNLTAQPGTTISPDETQTPLSPDITQTSTSPNDGYGNQDTASLSSIIQQFAPNLQNGQGVA